MGILQVAARFLRLNATGALHQHAGDDLKAVGDAVLDLLHQNGPFADEVVLEAGLGTRVGDVRDRKQEPNATLFAVIQRPGVNNQVAARLARPLDRR